MAIYLTPDRILNIQVAGKTLKVNQKIIPNGTLAQKDIASWCKKGQPIKPQVKTDNGSGKARGICIHNTGAITVNAATTMAEQYTRAMRNGNLNGSMVHYFVSNYNDIWQSLNTSPGLTEQGWHAADQTTRRAGHAGATYQQIGGNLDTIAIECIGDSVEAEDTTARLAAYLCKIHNLNPSVDIYGHNYFMGLKETKITYGARKNCPLYIIPHWAKFLATVQKYYDDLMGNKTAANQVVETNTSKAKIYTHPQYSYVRIIEIPKNEITKIDFALCKQPREHLSAFYNRQLVKPNLLTNLGFFNMSNGDTCFNFMDEGKVLHNDKLYQWGMMINGDAGLKYGHMKNAKRDFVSGYPVLLDAGQKVALNYATEINYKARRSVLGYNAKSVFVVLIENPGMRFGDMQTMLLKLGITDAINLDGGGSTQAWVEGKSIIKDYALRAVDSMLAIYTKYELPSLDSGSNTNYVVRITADSLNIRTGPGTNYKIVAALPKGGAYTIVEEKNGWGKLKSGAGWISLSYTTKLR